MILSFDKEAAEIFKHLGLKAEDVSSEAALNVAFTLAGVLLRGRSAGIDHACHIVSLRAMNPLAIINEIRKPVR